MSYYLARERVKRIAIFGAGVLTLFHATVASAQFNVGFAGGIAKGTAKEAIKEFEDTKFVLGQVISGSAGFRFGNGLTLEVNVQKIKMDLHELEDDFGTLELVPILGQVKYQGRPAAGSGISGHLEVGFGFVHQPSFTKGPAIRRLERQFAPATIQVDVATRPFVFQAGGGFDYFFARYVALITDFRFLITRIDSDWKAVAPGVVIAIPGESIDGFNGQALVGVRVFVG